MSVPPRLAPYFAEGFNLPVLEAAACGIPVICTRGGATDEFVTDEFAQRIDSQEIDRPGGKRVLVPNGDHLIQLLTNVISDESLRSRALSAGPAWISGRFTWKHTVDRLLALMLPD